MAKAARTYATLQAWMEATGTTTKELAGLAGIEYTHMSRLLTHSRRCSLEKAWRLHQVTGVPMENLVRWATTVNRDARAYPKRRNVA